MSNNSDFGAIDSMLREYRSAKEEDIVTDYKVLGTETILGKECDVMRWDDIVKRYPDKYIMLVDIKYDISASKSPGKFSAAVYAVYEEDEYDRQENDFYKLMGSSCLIGCKRTTEDRRIGLFW